MFSVVVALAAILTGIEELVLTPAELVAEDFQFTEGPLWLPGEGFVFSDIPADTIYRADKNVFRKPSGKSNGLALDKENRLVACEHWNRRVTRTEKDGTITVLADSYQGKKFNSPNDLVVRSDGCIYFTDPPYGLEGREPELDFSGVYLIDPKGGISLLFDEWKHPNGVALSPDEKRLYVGDSGAGLINVFDVNPDGTITNGRLFAEVPGPDGMKVDEEGRLWTTARDGVRVYTPDGAHVGTVAFPQVPANCAFGGDDGKMLLVTARTGVYKVQCAAKGLGVGGKP